MFLNIVVVDILGYIFEQGWRDGNVFQTDKLVEGQKQLKLSLTKLGAFPYIGRVIMSVSQYS